MSFLEQRFPVDISYGSRGGPGFNTNIITTDGGNEERVSRWQNGKRQYDVQYGIKSPDQMALVRDLHLVVRGAYIGFRYKDWQDYDSTSTGHHYIGTGGAITSGDQNLGTGDGAITQFQLVKRYTSGSSTIVRNITKPVSGTVVVALNAVTQSSGFSVDTTSGLVTFSSAPALGVVVTAGFEFDVPVRFSDTADKVLMASQADFGYGSLDPILLVELPDGLNVNDDAYCGGAVQICLTANWQLSAGYARGYAFEPQSAGLVVFLPDITNLPTGGPFFMLMNLGPNSLAVKTFGGTAFITLTSGQGVVVVLTIDGGGAKEWIAV